MFYNILPQWQVMSFRKRIFTTKFKHWQVPFFDMCLDWGLIYSRWH